MAIKNKPKSESTFLYFIDKDGNASRKRGTKTIANQEWRINQDKPKVSSKTPILLVIFCILLFAIFSILNFFGIFNSSKSQVINDLKATMNDPKSFELVEFKTLYDDDTYALHYIRFSGTNSFGGTVTNSSIMFYYQDNNCASETVGSDFLSYFSGLSDSYYISTFENRPMCRPQAWE